MCEKMRRDNKEKLTVITTALTTSICLMGNSMLYIVLPIYGKEVGITSLWQVGLLLSINRLVRLPLNPFVSWLYKRIHIRTGLLVAVLLAAISTTGYGVCYGFGQWLILRAIWGLAWSLLRVGGFLMVLNLASDKNRGYFIGIYNGLYQSGNVVGMLLGGFLVVIVGLRSLSLFLGVLTLIGIPLILYFVKKEQIPVLNREETKILEWSWVSKRVIRAILSGLLIYMIFEGMVTSTLSYIIAQHYGNTLRLFEFSIAATALSGIILGVRWAWEPILATYVGRKSDGKHGRVPLFIISLSFAAVSFCVIPNNISLYLWLGGCFLVLLSATTLITLADALAADTAKSSASLVVSTVYIMATDLGAALGPLVSYIMLRFDDGVSYIYYGSAVVFLLIASLWQLPARQASKGHFKAKL
ncbi:MFS transporter [Desulforamulus aeronauticus]|uniref:Predicted arabinose efflux permease, MFS family n=1 Tax=Desulforamulus aeronauticus DSM 10349 TaxID=1121421 RepID=A0A1M6SHZ8_9FIRM|nr:MFS transporter [Desulforamulus aeronauticus]SHK44371.1 Predicted arabinose efflux permease, MFS family [Desulforamulus aeronauticus DSM 10349]